MYDKNLLNRSSSSIEGKGDFLKDLGAGTFASTRLRSIEFVPMSSLKETSASL